MTAAQRAAIGVTIGWTDKDTIRWLTALAVTGPFLAIAMARWGTPPLDPMWQFHRVGIVGPTCGLTRATVALARGDLRAAWRFNPAALAVAAAGCGLIGRAAFAAVSGRWLDIRVDRRLLWALAPVLLVLSVNQQLHAAILIRP